MAKKKKRQTPKDDLIESLINDVQEISDQPTQRRKNAVADLFLDDEKTGVKNNVEDFLVGFNGEESRVQEQNSAVEGLWQQLKEPSAPDGPKHSGELDQASNQALTNREESSAEAVESSLVPSMLEEDSDDIDDSDSGYDDKTMDIQNYQGRAAGFDSSENSDREHDAEKTIAVEGFANRQPQQQKNISAKVSFGSLRDSRPATGGGGSIYASSDATLAQSESLKLAQQRILELEKEVEKYRQENEELASAGEIIRNRAEELTSRVFALEKDKQEVSDSFQNELVIIKGTLQYKETEVSKARLKIEELEIRLKSDFKKIRVRERELENRLELVKAEKTALLRAKDENILELKRKIDHLQNELDNYRTKVLELNKTIELNQEQFKRTVRALRLALSNLEVKEENIVPLKKAE